MKIQNTSCPPPKKFYYNKKNIALMEKYAGNKNMEKEEIIKEIKNFLTGKQKCNPSTIKDELKKKNIYAEDLEQAFGTKSITDILKTIPEIEFENDDYGTLYAKLKNSSEQDDSVKNIQESENPILKNETKLPLRKRIEKLLSFIGKDLIEKDEAVRLAFLASIAGESIFFLGPPGTAKSLVSRRLKLAFKGENEKSVSYFEYLMNQFSTPDEIFGPVSLKALEENKYERITQGFLPEANVAFLDEIWKASPAIQNTLLTILNEKKFHNGNKLNEVPLKALVSASNELPQKNQGLEALWDRFLIRAIVNPIQSDEDFEKFLYGEKVKAELEPTDSMKKNLILTSELEYWTEKIEKIEIPDEVRTVIREIRHELSRKNERRQENEKFYVSDRRWKKIIKILKTSAFLNGRNSVDLMDCQLVEYCIWNTESQIKEAEQIVKDCVEQNGLEVDTAVDDICDEIEEFDNYITEQFYVKEMISKPALYKMNDGNDAYKFVRQQNFSSYGNVSVTYINENNYYDADKNCKNSNYKVFPNSFKLIGNKVIFDDDYYRRQNYSYDNDYHHEFTIELKNCYSGKIVKNPDFEKYPDMEKTRQATADEKYNSILKSIKTSIQDVDNYISEKSAPFQENLFAEQKMRDVILKAVEKSKVELEKVEDDLNEVRKRYIQGS